MLNVVNGARKGVVLSWAVPGQPGAGHVNCRDNSWVIKRFADLGLKYEARPLGHFAFSRIGFAGF